MRLSRRKWALLFGIAPLAAEPLTTSAYQPPAPPPTGPEKAIQDVQRVSDRLSKLEVPMNVEPAFAFRP